MFQQILAKLDGRQPDLIISDIAPNISGVAVADQAASMYRVELTLDMVRQVLKPGGNYAVKVFGAKARKPSSGRAQLVRKS